MICFTKPYSHTEGLDGDLGEFWKDTEIYYPLVGQVMFSYHDKNASQYYDKDIIGKIISFLGVEI